MPASGQRRYSLQRPTWAQSSRSYRPGSSGSFVSGTGAGSAVGDMPTAAVSIRPNTSVCAPP